MLLTFGETTFQIIRFWDDSREVSYRILRGRRRGEKVYTVPLSRLKYNLDRYGGGSKIKKVLDDEIMWLKNDNEVIWVKTKNPPS
jgi:hypothetical protein